MFNGDEISLERLPAGAFLTSGNNVMTIGWGFIGYMWRKRVFIAPVRESRFTREFIDKTGEFAVSIPREGELKSALKLAGTKSGRDVDKLGEIDSHKAEKVNTVLIDGAEKYYECKVLANIPINKSDLDDSIKGFYDDDDMHILYIGEILD